jgi:hypothetical protein
LRQLYKPRAQFSPAKLAAEHIAEYSMSKKSLFSAVIIVHVFLLKLFLMMPTSIFFKAGPNQSLPLWARSGAIDSAKWVIGTLEGMIAKAGLIYDRIPDSAGFCAQCRIFQQPPSLQLSWFALLQPANVADRSGLPCD